MAVQIFSVVYKQRSVVAGKRHAVFEPLFQYECLCPGCNYGLKVIRVNGGLVALEKCTVENGRRFSIAHTRKPITLPQSTLEVNVGASLLCFMPRNNL